MRFPGHWRREVIEDAAYLAEIQYDFQPVCMKKWFGPESTARDQKYPQSVVKSTNTAALTIVIKGTVVPSAICIDPKSIPAYCRKTDKGQTAVVNRPYLCLDWQNKKTYYGCSLQTASSLDCHR